MMTPDGTHWSTDEALFASLPGGRAVIDWFGFVPSFHDSELEWLKVANGAASLALRTFRMTDAVDAAGYFVLDKHALVTLHLSEVTGLSLSGDAASIIFRLGVRRIGVGPSGFSTYAGPSAGDIEVGIESSYGMSGSLYARGVSFGIIPA